MEGMEGRKEGREEGKQSKACTYLAKDGTILSTTVFKFCYFYIIYTSG